MSVAETVVSQVMVPPIYRGKDFVCDLDPPEGESYSLSGSTFEFAIGTVLESPTLTITSTLTSGSQVTVPSGDTIRVKIDRLLTKTLTAGRNYWLLTEIDASGEHSPLAAGVVDVRKGAGTLPT